MSTCDAPWVIWNGQAGLLAMAELGRVEAMATGGRSAWLAAPFDMVGPFSLDELEGQGRIHFEACTVMSRARWQADQADLRQRAFEQRRAAQARHQAREQARQQAWQRRAEGLRGADHDEPAHRAALKLPAEGPLTPQAIKAAYRRQAQRAHPDAGGDHQAFVQIGAAKRALLARYA
ncbi:MAG: hypothetical protein RI907_3048 [Pseudomonadota bacterium]|jgi:hypothetical protein